MLLFGGIRAVTFTDVIQFAVFMLVIPVLCYFIFQSINVKVVEIPSLITNTRFDLAKVMQWDAPCRDMLLLGLTFLTPKMTPIAVQRIYMSSNVWQARRVFSYAGLISMLINITIFLSVILLFTKNATIASGGVVNYIMAHYNNIYFLVLMGIGTLALAMSTADSDLNTSSVIFVNDIAKVAKMHQQKSLLWARISSLILGILGITLAFSIKDLLKIMVLRLSFYIPIVSVPFIMAILGFRPATKSVLLGMGSGLLTVIGLKVYPLFAINNVVIPGMLANLIVLIGSYYLLPKVPNTGWVGIKTKNLLL